MSRQPTKITDLFGIELFRAMVDKGYVRVQTHPTLPLCIANYSEKAQYERVWNEVTLQCRGLIYDHDGAIVARPYAKFFNYGDDENTGPLDLNAAVQVTDKLDGSLGIAYPTPDGPAIATRGSFASDQALHATELLRSKYPAWRTVAGLTHLFEIIYPDNRIVIDYAGIDELCLHGIVDIPTGVPFVPSRLATTWHGPIVQTFPYETLAEALAAKPRPNAEGFVVRFDGGKMVKLKQDDYVALHRIVTGLNARTVWEWLGDGKTVGDLCATLPDEFHGWVEDLAAEIYAEQDSILAQALYAYTRRPDGLASRAEFAAYAKQQGELTPYLFMLFDGQDERVIAAAWRAVKPSGARTLINRTGANA